MKNSRPLRARSLRRQRGQNARAAAVLGWALAASSCSGELDRTQLSEADPSLRTRALEEVTPALTPLQAAPEVAAELEPEVAPTVPGRRARRCG